MQKTLVYSVKQSQIYSVYMKKWNSSARQEGQGQGNPKANPAHSRLYTLIVPLAPLINTKIKMDKLQVNGTPTKDMRVSWMVLEWIRKDLVMWNRLRWLKSPCELKVMSALSRVIIGSLYLFKMWTMWLTCLVSRFLGNLYLLTTTQYLVTVQLCLLNLTESDVKCWQVHSVLFKILNKGFFGMFYNQ